MKSRVTNFSRGCRQWKKRKKIKGRKAQQWWWWEFAICNDMYLNSFIKENPWNNITLYFFSLKKTSLTCGTDVPPHKKTGVQTLTWYQHEICWVAKLLFLPFGFFWRHLKLLFSVKGWSTTLNTSNSLKVFFFCPNIFFLS